MLMLFQTIWTLPHFQWTKNYSSNAHAILSLFRCIQFYLTHMKIQFPHIKDRALNMSSGSWISTVIRLWTRQLGFDSWQVQVQGHGKEREMKGREGIFPPSHHIQTGSGAHPVSYPGKYWWGDLSSGVQQPRHEAVHSHPCRPEVTNVWSHTSALPVHLHGMALN
jgi:hypothetical protein